VPQFLSGTILCVSTEDFHRPEVLFLSRRQRSLELHVVLFFDQEFAAHPRQTPVDKAVGFL
jgi:hypothetical protein